MFKLQPFKSKPLSQEVQLQAAQETGQGAARGCFMLHCSMLPPASLHAPSLHAPLLCSSMLHCSIAPWRTAKAPVLVLLAADAG